MVEVLLGKGLGRCCSFIHLSYITLALPLLKFVVPLRRGKKNQKPSNVFLSKLIQRNLCSKCCY